MENGRKRSPAQGASFRVHNLPNHSIPPHPSLPLPPNSFTPVCLLLSLFSPSSPTHPLSLASQKRWNDAFDEEDGECLFFIYLMLYTKVPG